MDKEHKIMWVKHHNNKIIVHREGRHECEMAIRQKDYENQENFQTVVLPYFEKGLEEGFHIHLYRDKMSYTLLTYLLDSKKILAATLYHVDDKTMGVEIHGEVSISPSLQKGITKVNNVREYIKACNRMGMYE